MRTETLAYRAERLKWVTQPRVFLRAYYVRHAGLAEYAFSRDFAMDDVVSATTPKLKCVKTIQGAAQQADPIAGRSSIGFFEFQLGDAPTGARHILRQVADPARPLLAAMGSGDGHAGIRHSNKFSTVAAATEGGVVIQVDNIAGYPDLGHVIIDTEDFSYTGRNLATNTFTGVRRARRDTVLATHPASALVRNGEQLRRGARVTVFLGYAPLPEAEYGPGPGYTKMEIQSASTANFNMTWSFRCSDIQRFAKRRIFESATLTNPTVLGPDHPLTLMLKVLTSTGGGTNGAYDVLTVENGAAVPVDLIDVAGWEAMRGQSDFTGMQMTFNEVGSQDAKEWVESQILRPLGILPYVNQGGQYSGRAIAQSVWERLGAWSNFVRGETYVAPAIPSPVITVASGAVRTTLLP